MTPSAELRPLGTPEATLEAASQEIGVQLAPGQAALLVRFTALLQRWNAVYNLTAVRDPASILVAHTKDEFVLKKDLEEAVNLYFDLAKRLLAR